MSKMSKVILILIVACSVLLTTGCKKKEMRTVDITRYGDCGIVLDVWKNAKLNKTGSGWVNFYTQDGRNIIIESDHKIEYH